MSFKVCIMWSLVTLSSDKEFIDEPQLGSKPDQSGAGLSFQDNPRISKQQF